MPDPRSAQQAAPNWKDSRHRETTSHRTPSSAKEKTLNLIEDEVRKENCRPCRGQGQEGCEWRQRLEHQPSSPWQFLSAAGRLFGQPPIGEKRRGLPGARFLVPGSPSGIRFPSPSLGNQTGEARVAPFTYSGEHGRPVIFSLNLWVGFRARASKTPQS